MATGSAWWIPSYQQDPLSENTFSTLQLIGCAVIGSQHLLNGFLNLWIIMVSMRGRERLMNWQFLVLNLCLVNVILGLSLAPTFFLNLFSGGWATGHGGCIFSGFMYTFIVMLTLYLFIIIAVDRYIGIQYANKGFTRPVLYASVVFAWVLALIIASLPLFDINDYILAEEGLHCSADYRVGGLPFLLPMLVLLSMAVTQVALVYCYGMIYYRYRNSPYYLLDQSNKGARASVSTNHMLPRRRSSSSLKSSTAASASASASPAATQANDEAQEKFSVAKRCVLLVLVVVATWGLYMCLVAYVMITHSFAWLIVHLLAAILVHVNPFAGALVYTYGEDRFSVIKAIKEVLLHISAASVDGVDPRRKSSKIHAEDTRKYMIGVGGRGSVQGRDNSVNENKGEGGGGDNNNNNNNNNGSGTGSGKGRGSQSCGHTPPTQTARSYSSSITSVQVQLPTGPGHEDKEKTPPASVNSREITPPTSQSQREKAPSSSSASASQSVPRAWGTTGNVKGKAELSEKGMPQSASTIRIQQGAGVGDGEIEMV